MKTLFIILIIGLVGAFIYQDSRCNFALGHKLKIEQYNKFGIPLPPEEGEYIPYLIRDDEE